MRRTWRQYGVPLYILVAGLVLGVVLLTTGLQLLNIRKESLVVAQRQASESFAIVYSSVRDDVHHSVDPILDLVNSSPVLYMSVGLDGIQEAKNFYLNGCLQALASYDNIFAVNYGFTDGTFFSVSALRSELARTNFKAPPDALYAVWAVVRERNGQYREWWFYLDETFREIGQRDAPRTYDPREKLWFVSAMEADGIVMTNPYVFTTSRSLGVAAAKAMPNRAGVFSVNITLGNFNKMLGNTLATSQGHLLLLDNEQIIAASNPSIAARIVGGELLPLFRVDDRAVQEAYAFLKNRKFEAQSNRRLRLNGQDWFLQYSPFSMGSRQMNVLLMVPVSAYTAFADSLFFNSSLFALFAFLFSTPLAFWLAMRVSHSLSRLMDETRRIASEESGGSARLRSHIFEVNLLARTMARMERIIRNRTADLRAIKERLELMVRERTQELNVACERAEEASQAKSTFLATMSHEIRTPMNAIIGFTHLFDTSNLHERQRDHLSKIRLSAETLLTIINDVLDFSKIEARRLTLEAIPFQLLSVVKSVESIIGLAADKKGLALQVYIDPTVPNNLVGDPTRLHQILLNLLSNAVKFTFEGMVSLDIWMDSDQPDNSQLEDTEAGQSVRLSMRVTDTGIGIMESRLQAIFEPFTQADQSVTRRFGGTGLGLVICRQLAEMMGGDITVRSVPEQGTTFVCRVVLVTRNEADEDSVHNHGASPLTLLSEYAGARVLVVEDNEINREIALAMLEPSGLRVDVAVHGQHCLEMLATHLYDAVLMDMQMPVMDGLEATRQLRALKDGEGRQLFSSNRLPVIAMTANAMAEDRRACLESGMNDYISKPIHPDTLYQVLARWIAVAQKYS